MKTTIELSASLLEKAKVLARERGTTLRAIIEESLLKSLSQPREVSRFQLKDCSVSGKGPRAQFADADWAQWRSAAALQHLRRQSHKLKRGWLALL